ncbi:hypothetical protein D3C77_630580 [compost metagenome]
MAEGEPSYRYALRQAREKLCGDGLTRLCHAVFATLLFVQSLEVRPNLFVIEADALRNMASPKVSIVYCVFFKDLWRCLSIFTSTILLLVNLT